jgi:glycosyltransferase 2 family protein
MGGRLRLNRVVKIGFGLAVVAFGAWFIASRWYRVQAALSTARPGWVVLAAVFGVLGLLCTMAAFRGVLQGVARKLPVREVGRVHFTSQLGKYVPGSIWSLVALTEMGGRYQISRRAAASAGVLALVLSITTGGIVGVTLVVIAAARTSSSLWWLLLLLPVAFVIGHPSVVMTVVNRVLRLVHREPVEVSLRGAALRNVLLWQFGVWLFLGLHCWALVVALGGDAASVLIPAIGGFALAFTAGTLFVPAPAGAGVREAVLALALVNVTRDSAAFSHSSIIVVVLLSRVLLAVFDFALAGFWLLMARKRPSEMTTL